MVDVVVVEVDGLLDQAHAEDLDIEVQIFLGVVDRAGDVMQAADDLIHEFTM